MFKLKKKKLNGGIALKVYEARESLRVIDELLETLQEYFQKVEKKLSDEEKC